MNTTQSGDTIFEITEEEAPPEPSTPDPPAELPPAAPEEPPESSTESSEGEGPPPTEEATTEESGDIEDTSTDEPPVDEEVYFEGADGTKYAGNTTFKKKIDGKIQDVKLSDVLDEYSGRFAVKERFAESNKIKQKSEHVLSQVGEREYGLKKVATQFLNAMSNGNTRDAIDVLCEFTGQDPGELWQNVVKSQRTTAEKLTQMSDEEYQAHEAKEDAQYWQRKSQVGQDNQADQALRARKSEAQEKHGLNDDEMKGAYQILLDMKGKGEYNQELTLDDVVSTALDYRIYGDIDAAVKEHLPDKIGDSEFYQEIFRDTKQHNLTNDDWISILKEIKKNEAVTSKLTKNAEANTSPTKGQKKATKSGTVDDESDYLDIVDQDGLDAL